MRVRHSFLLVRLAACASLLLTAAPLRGQQQAPLLSRPLGLVWKYETDETVNFTPAHGAGSMKVPVKLSDLSFTGACRVRDLWRRRALGEFEGEFAPEINWHGAGLYRVSPGQNHPR